MKEAIDWLKRVRWVRIEIWGLIGLSFLLVLLVMGLVLSDTGAPSSLARFFGRFHPVIVHLPIGMLLLAGLLEVFSARFESFRTLRHATAFVLYLGAVGAAASVLAGLLLSAEGGYDPDLLGTHKWVGFAVAAGAVVAAGLRMTLDRGSRSGGAHRVGLYRLYASVLSVTVVLLLYGGHLGGSLTHGPNYLTQHMPGPLKTVFAAASLSPDEDDITNVDSALVYDDLIEPIFERRCVECHGPAKSKGKLRLDTQEGLLKGGEDGPVVEPGSPSGSELLRRVTLPLDDEDVMPPDGEPPLTIGETELIRWWIENDASFEKQVADIEEIPSAVETALIRIAGPRPEQKSRLYAFEVEPVDTAAVAALEEAGLNVERVAGDLALLQISASNLKGEFDSETAALLSRVAPQVTWLDLSGTDVEDEELAALTEMVHLTRLELDRTAVSDDGLVHLKHLGNLETLNLYGTKVTDDGLELLLEIPKLRTVYLWQTEVTAEGAERFRRQRPNVRLNLGESVAGAGAVDTGATRAAGN